MYQKSKTSDGKRHIIVHAGSQNGFLENAGLIFSTSNKSADYHDSMNADLFEKWFEESVLQRLEEPTLIVLDNAPYHSRQQEKWPTGSWTKHALLEWLNVKQVAYPANSTKVELLSVIKAQKRPGKVYVIDVLANSYGHRILRLPPYHCELNAIEMVWGIAKTYYNKHIVLTSGSEGEVLSIWDAALKSITANEWQKCVQKTERLIRETLEKEHLVDDVRPLIITDANDSDDEDSDESDEDN